MLALGFWGWGFWGFLGYITHQTTEYEAALLTILIGSILMQSVQIKQVTEKIEEMIEMSMEDEYDEVPNHPPYEINEWGVIFLLYQKNKKMHENAMLGQVLSAFALISTIKIALDMYDPYNPLPAILMLGTGSILAASLFSLY